MSALVPVRQYPANAKPPIHTPLFPDAVRFTGVHLVGAPGTGKSWLLGRGPMYDDFIRGIPQVVFDVTGGAIDSFLDKLSQIVPDFERRWWPHYRQPLPPEWVQSLESVQALFAKRIVYVDLSGKQAVMPFPLLYRLFPDESLYEIAQRPIEVFARMDPDLARAPVEGMNSLQRVGTNVHEILAALGLQITEAPELIYHPEWWSQRFEQAITAYPEVAPALAAMKEFGKNKLEYRVRRSDSYLTKIDPSLKDPYQRAMFGAATPGIDWQQVIDKKQTVLLDGRQIESTEQLRFTLLWVFMYLLTFLKRRGPAGRQNPLAIVIDELSVLLGLQANQQALMAEDIRLLLEVIGRNYGCWITLAHQRLSQILDQSIVDALMQMGTQCIGRVSSPDEAEYLAKHFFRFNPKWVKKEEPVYMMIHPKPIFTEILGGAEFPEPEVIDYRTVEYTLDEQRTLTSYHFTALGKLQFLTRTPLTEGDRAGEVQLMDFNSFDTGRYLTDEQLAETRRRLAKRSGYAKEELLAQIEQRALKSVKKKQVQASKEPAKLNRNDIPADRLPVAPAPATPVSAAGPPPAPAGGAADEEVFQ